MNMFKKESIYENVLKNDTISCNNWKL